MRAHFGVRVRLPGMTQLAFITFDDSKYDDRLWQLLEESGVPADEFETLDYFSLLPFFVLAGASVDTQVESHGDHFHFQGVRLTIADDMVEPFYDGLEGLLAQLEEHGDAG
jgi:hypothetical protein